MLINVSTNRTAETNVNKQIRAALLGQGMTLTDWAIANRFRVQTVFQTLWRFAGQEKRPRKGVSLDIIVQLESETGIKICGKHDV